MQNCGITASSNPDGNPMGPAVKGKATGTRITVDDINPGSLSKMSYKRLGHLHSG